MKKSHRLGIALTLILFTGLAPAWALAKEPVKGGPHEVPMNQAMDNPNWQNLTGDLPETTAPKAAAKKPKHKNKASKRAHPSKQQPSRATRATQAH